MYMFMYICIHVSVHIYIYTHVHRRFRHMYTYVYIPVEAAETGLGPLQGSWRRSQRTCTVHCMSKQSSDSRT